MNDSTVHAPPNAMLAMDHAQALAMCSCPRPVQIDGACYQLPSPDVRPAGYGVPGVVHVVAKMQVNMVLSVEALGCPIRGRATLPAWEMGACNSLTGPGMAGLLASWSLAKHVLEVAYEKYIGLTLDEE